MVLCVYLFVIIWWGVVEFDFVKCKVMLIFIVCGFGFIGFELIGELIEYCDVLV